MTFELPDPRLADPAFLAASMHDGQYLGSGTNNDVWRIDGLGKDQSYIVRVSNLRRALFTDVNNPPRMETCLTAAMDARAAQPIAVFFAKDEKGKEHQVADIQPELKGALMGLTRDEMELRTNKIKEVLTATDGWGRVPGNIVTRHETNQEGVDRTNPRLWDLAEKIAAMPVTFFIQLIKDAKEIEEAGYGIDPSKGANFMLLDGQNRVGFVDLMPKDDYKYRMTPHALATVLWQPANQTWGGRDSPDQHERRANNSDIIHAKMIMACDACRIAYGYTQSMDEQERNLRAQFGLKKPDHVRLIRLDEVTKVPTGHYGVTSKDISVPRDAGPSLQFPAPQ